MQKVKDFNDYLSRHEVWKSKLILLRQHILASGLEEGIKWGAPVYMLDGKNVVGLAAFKKYAGVWFFHGAALSDPDKILINAQQGKTKNMRQWRWDQNDVIDIQQLAKFLAEAIKLQSNGNLPQPAPAKTMVIPIELLMVLKKDKTLKSQFESLTPYKQHEFAEHIASARREVTRLKRLQQSVVLIQAGVGLNDKYRSC